MAEENPHEQPDQEVDRDEERRLKYLEFVQGASLHALMCFMSLYEYAKDKSGPLKPGVQTVEGTVKTVVGPVYHKFHDVPKDLLKFVDRKVDESVVELDRRVPPTWKQASSQAFTAAQKAPEFARAVASEVNRNVVDSASEFAKTVYAKCEPTAKDLYSKYEPKAEQCAVSAWHKLNKLPLFPQLANVIVPKAAYCSEKYNETVHSAAEKGYRVSSYLPLVPTEKIARVFSGNDETINEPLLPNQPGAEHTFEGSPPPSVPHRASVVHRRRRYPLTVSPLFVRHSSPPVSFEVVHNPSGTVVHTKSTAVLQPPSKRSLCNTILD